MRSHFNGKPVQFQWLIHRVKEHKSNKCLFWDGRLEKTGYARIRSENGPKEFVHRIAYRLFVKPIPKGKFVLHHCDNRSCFWYMHLYLGTKKKNSEDMVERGRSMRGERNCKAKLTPENVIEIRRLYKEGINATVLGFRFGVDRTVAWQAATRRTWKYLT